MILIECISFSPIGINYKVYGIGTYYPKEYKNPRSYISVNGFGKSG
jgi:hypothetical protein